MADTGRPDDDGPSLEMPSFSLRRRKRAAPPEEAVGDTAPDPAPDPAPDLAPDPSPVLEPEPVQPRRRRDVTLAGLPAAAVTGVAVGVLAVVVALLAGATCEAVRGTSSCGGAVGLPILIVTLVLLAYAGGVLLRALGVPDAGSTSLLAVGVLAVLVMVFLLGSLDEWWALVAVPVVAVLAYVGSWWLTTSVVGEDAGADAAASHDVR